MFSGFGGFDLAAEWMGWENAFHCEWMKFTRHVLNFYWPQAKSYEDIRKTDFTIWRGRIDVLSGGFPCQPYSSAGKRKGKEDERHLWPEMLRAIREIQPVYVVGENVRGLTNWNGGLVFDEVQSDLESAGYEVLPFLLPACAVDAPHRRDRIWLVAYKDSNRNGRTDKQWEKKSGIGQFGDIGTGNNEWLCTNHGQVGVMANDGSARPSREGSEVKGEGGVNDDESKSGGESPEQHFGHGDVPWTDTNANMHGCNGCNGQYEVNTSEGREHAQCDVSEFCSHHDADASSKRLQGNKYDRASNKRVGPPKSFGSITESCQIPHWQQFPTQSPVCSGDDGLSFGLDSVAISKVKGEKMMNDKRAYNYWRQESIKGFGNAVVPQLVLPIFKAINQHLNLGTEVSEQSILCY